MCMSKFNLVACFSNYKYEVKSVNTKIILLDFVNIYYVLHFCSNGDIYMYI